MNVLLRTWSIFAVSAKRLLAQRGLALATLLGLAAALGFLLYALFTFRRRSVELGVMRAMGMSAGQLAVYVVCEWGFYSSSVG